MTTRADQIRERFLRFHREHPEVWRLFCVYADAMRAKRPRYSADAILHRVRWEIALRATDGSFKINDHYSAYYARMYIATHPGSHGFFAFRLRRSAHERPRSDRPWPMTPHEPVNETELLAELRDVAAEASP